MAKFVVMLRVKDGLFFAKEWLECFEKLADEIVVLDNGSTDGTYEILKAHPKVVDIMQTEGYNEGRDKNMMYDRTRLRNPDWLLWVDIDEVFEPEITRKDFDRLMSSKIYNKFAFRRFHFMDREHFAGSLYRLNYTSGHDRLMWREHPSGHFQNLIIDSPNVKGIKGLKKNTDFRLKHLGYINKDLVNKKAELYRSIIPDKEDIFQSMYLQGERPIKFQNDRKHIKTILMHQLLNALQMTHIVPKVIRRVKQLF
jgi:glycosyltransferase involved in cell wall biosynthesis